MIDVDITDQRHHVRLHLERTIAVPRTARPRRYHDSLHELLEHGHDQRGITIALSSLLFPVMVPMSLAARVVERRRRKRFNRRLSRELRAVRGFIQDIRDHHARRGAPGAAGQ